MTTPKIIWRQRQFSRPTAICFGRHRLNCGVFVRLTSITFRSMNRLAFWDWHLGSMTDIRYWSSDQIVAMDHYGHRCLYEKVDLINRSDKVDLTNYMQNGEWDLMETSISRAIVYYPCCSEHFPEVVVKLKIRRKTLYYIYNIIMPCILLAIITITCFRVPPDSGEKTALPINVFLAYMVSNLQISTKLPESSESMPLLGII